MPDETAGELFSGDVPEMYERLMVPFMFEPYADDLAARAAARHPGRVLEVAAGTGVVTRRLAAVLPAEARIVATDLSPGMLELARRAGAPRPQGSAPVEWAQADAQALPFADESFDLVVCQFGVMFFPDRVGAYREARRVLRPGGALVFSAWDAPEHNTVVRVVEETCRELLPDDPPDVIVRVTHAYTDPGLVSHELETAGLAAQPVERVDCMGSTPSARAAVVAICRGSPLRFDLEAHGIATREAVEDAASERLAAEYGAGPVSTALRALVATAIRR